MKALIDGDIGIYRVGFASQDVPVHFAQARMKTWVEDICKACDTQDYQVFLTSTDKSNFRFHLFPEYKANRTQPKPIHYDALREYLLAHFRTSVVHEREADDALADNQTDQTIIASIDKDLDQIPGEHYDFVKDVRYTVSAQRGLRFFYLQLLQGDRTDNIPGIEGIGPKKAEAILDGVDVVESQLFQRVREAYQNKYGEKGDELMLLYGRLLKIGGDLWEFPEDTGVQLEESSIEAT
jgi:5'-3' exonuclease